MQEASQENSPHASSPDSRPPNPASGSSQQNARAQDPESHDSNRYPDGMAFSYFRMGGVLVIGTCVAVAHHFFCRSLSGRPIDLEFNNDLLKFTIDAPWALTIGNAFAWLVQFLFLFSISEVMIQQFWHLLHTKPISLEKMDDIWDIQTSFWKNPSVWTYAPFLSSLALILLAMSATIITFASPALSAGPTLLYRGCNLSTVDLGNSELLIDGSATPALAQLAIRTLEFGSYLPPLTSPCGNCTYNVTYTAPALQCSHIDIASSPFTSDSANDTVLWNSSLAHDPSGGELFVWLRQGVITSDISAGDPEIASCKAMNATYSTNVEYISGTGAVVNTTVQIMPGVVSASGNVTVQQQQMAFSAMMDALYAALQGTLTVSTSVNGIPHVSQNTLVTFSPLGNYTLESWTINGDLLTVLPMLMQNFSVGLLAKSVAADATSSTLSSVSDGHCFIQTTVYKYDHVRLLSIYGAGIVVTTVCAVFGIYSLYVGKGGSMSLRSIIFATLSKDMIKRVPEDGYLPSTIMIKANKGRFEPQDPSSDSKKWLCC